MTNNEHILKESVSHWVSREFDMIPVVLFQDLLENINSFDLLELIDSPARLCPDCDYEIEHNDPWHCENCGEHNSTPWEDLPLKEADHWPGSHGTLFWTTHKLVATHAANCGFYVYEPQQFDGILLAVDGGGYDFFEEHWAPLYHAMGIKWHENNPQWNAGD